MWRVYSSSHDCFTSLTSLLNSQVVFSPLLALQFQASRALALSAHLLLRSPFTPMLLHMKSDHAASDPKLLCCLFGFLRLVFTTCPDWTSKQQSAGVETAPGTNTTCRRCPYSELSSFHEQTLLSMLCVSGQFSERWNGCFWWFWRSITVAFLKKKKRKQKVYQLLNILRLEITLWASGVYGVLLKPGEVVYKVGKSSGGTAF